jgi:predicted aspartyl protease
MTVRVYVNSVAKRTDTLALVDSGATENFMSQEYARYARLPMKQLTTPRKVFNVDGTPNRNGDITHYTYLELRTGKQ